uniref:Uncharacterized protein n=1 Tax=Aquila chrysaetos chrysaetos TaxID=223781 RepID=A0A663DVU3_AQUCH
VRHPEGLGKNLQPAVIIDNGSSFTRAGFAGQKKPKFVLRTMLLPPCSAGTIMENLWNHLFFCGLKALPEEQPVLMADSPSCPSTNREKVAEVLFERPAPALLQGCEVNSNAPKEINCFSFTPQVISVPVHHHSIKHVSDQAGNTTTARAVNSGHADCLGTAGRQPSPNAAGWRLCTSTALQQNCLF